MSTRTVTLEGREYTLTFEDTGALADISYVDAGGRRRPLSVNGKVAKQAVRTLELLELDDAFREQPRPTVEQEEAAAREDMLTDYEPTIVDEAPEVDPKTLVPAEPGQPLAHPSFQRLIRRAWGLARAINTTNALMKSRPRNAVELRELLGCDNPQYEVPKFRHATPARVPVSERVDKGGYGKGLMRHFARKRLEARNG